MHKPLDICLHTYTHIRTYCDRLIRALTKKPRVTRSTIELWLLSNESPNNHDNRGTTEDNNS